MSYLRLLAKSAEDADSPRRAETLVGHTALVLAAADELLAARGRSSLVCAGLPETRLVQLERIVRLAAFVHDLGKCSDHFQGLVRGRRKAPQLVRHEALSLWLAWPGQPLSDWLRSAVESDLDYHLALIAAAGHHRKFWADAIREEGAGTRLSLLVDHADFADVLRFGAGRLQLPAPPALSAPLDVEATRRHHPAARFETWEEDANKLVRAASAEARLLAACKALTIAADVAGSALPRGGETADWIRGELDRCPAHGQLVGIVEKKLAGSALRPFQRAVADSAAPLVLARAGCGTGKTLAAYLWAAERHAGRKLWIAYPTTGTTTEGFRDYLFDAGVAARLEHGRAAIDLEIFRLRGDGEGPRDRDRLDALRAWGSEVVSCTVDTVLGLVQNQRKGLYAWPALAGAAVVFDEVHAYDDQLFGSLLRFLEALPGVPVLLMTASLPAGRLATLRSLCERVHGRPLDEIAGPENLERLPRYRLREAGDPWPLVDGFLTQGGKVLWVSNTVDRCLAVADRAGDRALVYHSRFRYFDRVLRHGDVIEAFRAPGAAFAATTQVAEMSLDLSADLLITDLAPIPALIQRLGRLNRRSTPERAAPVAPFIVLPFTGLPYEGAELDAASTWLASLAGRDLSQGDLVNAWRMDDGVAPAGVASAWLDGRFETRPAPCREASPGITVLLERDAGSVTRGERKAAEVAVPMNPPPTDEWRRWREVEWYPVAPPAAIDYDPRRGAKWRR